MSLLTGHKSSNHGDMLAPRSGHSSSHTTKHSHRSEVSKSKLDNVGLKDLIYIKNNKEAHLAAKAKIS